MPIYEYLCDACQNRLEVKQKVSDPPLAVCERCGGALRKLISSPAIMFKGSGWYVTDYSDKLKPPAEAGAASGTDKKEAPAAAGAAAPTGGDAGSGNGASASAPGTPVSPSTTSTPAPSTAAT